MKVDISVFLALLVVASAASDNVLAQGSAGALSAQPYWLAPDAVDRFYASYPDDLHWEDDADFAELIEAVESLRAHGLDPAHYHLDELVRDSANVAARDRLATDAWFSAAAHMLYGKLDAATIEPDWTAGRREADLSAKLTEAITNGTVAVSLNQFAPKQIGYTNLLTEYDKLKTQAEDPIADIPLGETLRPGMNGGRVVTLQNRLLQLGLMTQSQLSGVVDVETQAAIRLFQLSAELDDDGIAGPVTLTALNRSVLVKLNQLRVNLERWRWLPEDLGRRHVRANIANFSVTTWNNGGPIRTHLAIVGKAYRRTPVFSDEIEYIVFNPWWETPASIARADKLPLFRQDPDAVQNLGFQVLDRSGQLVNPATINWNEVSPGSFPYRLRQAPGEQNALGQVKIMFPNTHNIYLHDTPTRGLFSQRQRAFSSGCVRTQYPLDLATWLLEETSGWTRERIDAAVASGLETRANLAARIPVHILYFTVVSEENNGVRYLDDIYGRDIAVLNGLLAPPT